MTESTDALKEDHRKALLSALWVVVMINMLKADILSLHIPGSAEELARAAASMGASIPHIVLGGAMMMEISIAMIILSRVFERQLNRWANMVASVVTMVYVVGGAAPYPHHTFIALIEVICLALIFWIAMSWRSTVADAW